eukprot:21531_1
MASLFNNAPPPKVYYDRKTYSSFQAYLADLEGTRTLYVGNLAFSTTETQVRELFYSVGHIESVIMGLDRLKRTKCGFCFVEMSSTDEAINAVNYISDTALDGVVIRVELDPGFRPGRQYGRGMSGGQVRDEKRTNFDPARGGLGRQAEEQMMRREKRRREYSANETNTGDDDMKEGEEMDTKRLIYGELSTKRRRIIPENEEKLPTDDQHDGMGEKEEQLENNIPTEAAEPPPFSTEANDSSDHQGTSKADNMNQDHCLDEEVVLSRDVYE